MEPNEFLKLHEILGNKLKLFWELELQSNEFLKANGIVENKVELFGKKLKPNSFVEVKWTFWPWNEAEFGKLQFKCNCS